MANPLDPGTAADDAAPEISEEQRARMTYKKLFRRKRRKEREAAGEIRELNITAMMDMMTIILVFLLKSYSASSVNMASSGDIAPPISSTRLAPKDTVAVTVTRCSPGPDRVCRPGSGSLMVGDKTVFSYENDAFPATAKAGGETGLLVEPLREALQKEVDTIKRNAQFNSAVQFTGEVSIVGDRNMPYRMLAEILYTAGQVELDSYRFVVIKREGSDAAPGGGDG